MQSRLLAVFASVFALCPIAAFADTLHVPAHYRTIQEGIDAAVDKDRVVVDEGVYLENLDFRGKAIRVESAMGPDRTVIDGSGCINGKEECSAVTFRSGETESSVLSGFRITFGKGSVVPEAMGHKFGGGVFCYFSEPTIENCVITDNFAFLGNGGGIWCYWSYPTINNSVISRNFALSGGGVYSQDSYPQITNCTLSDNIAWNGGGLCSQDSSPMMTNCILWNNHAWSGKEIWAGTHARPSTLSVSFSDIEGGPQTIHIEEDCELAWLDGNIDSDPIFSDDYHLSPGSPCIDAGTVTGVYTDIDGELRPDGAAIDMGADEYMGGICFVTSILQ